MSNDNTISFDIEPKVEHSDGTTTAFQAERIVEQITKFASDLPKGSYTDPKVTVSSFMYQLPIKIKTTNINRRLAKHLNDSVSVAFPNDNVIAGRILNKELEREYLQNVDNPEMLFSVHANLTGGDAYQLEDYCVQNFADIAREFDDMGDIEGLYTYPMILKHLNSNFLKHEGKLCDTLKFLLMRLAIRVSGGDATRAKFIYKQLATFKIGTSTPMSSKGRQFASCFVVPVSDNINDILNSCKDISAGSKLGGGFGVLQYGIRSLGSPVQNKPGVSKGPMAYSKIYERLLQTIDQLGCVHQDSLIPVIDYVNVETSRSRETTVKLHKPSYKHDRVKLTDLKDMVTIMRDVVDQKFVDSLEQKGLESRLSLAKVRSLLADFIKYGFHKDIESKYQVSEANRREIVYAYRTLEKPIPKGFVEWKPNILVNEQGHLLYKDTLRPVNRYVNEKGYSVASIDKRNYKTHRIVAETFLKDFDRELTVDHIDANQLNNNVKNLKMLNRSENTTLSFGNNNQRTLKTLLRKFLSGKNTKFRGRIIDIGLKYVPMKEIKINDIVVNFDGHTDNVRYNRVERVSKHKTEIEDQVLVCFSDKAKGKNIVTKYIVAKDHPCFIYNDMGNVTSVPAEDIQIGDASPSNQNQERLYVVKKVIGEEIYKDKDVDVKETTKFLDLTVENMPNYFCHTGKVAPRISALVHNTRKGSGAVYMHACHTDIMMYVDSLQSSRTEDQRLKFLQIAIWMPDLAYERVKTNEDLTLFDPYYVGDLFQLTGKSFEARYLELEKDESVPRTTINAKYLFSKIIKAAIDFGQPFIGNDGVANRRNMNKGSGKIHLSNLCTEIFQNTAENSYKPSLTLVDDEGSIVKVESEVGYRLDEVKIGDMLTKKHINLKAELPYGDTIDYLPRYDDDHMFRVIRADTVNDYSRVDAGLSPVCFLSSVVLGNIKNDQELRDAVRSVVIMLDNAIDMSIYPYDNAAKHSHLYRGIGVGVSGEETYRAVRRIEHGTPEHYEMLDELYEKISYYAIEMSIELAKHKGSYRMFPDSEWSKGVMPFDSYEGEYKKTRLDWDKLREDVQKHGIRNGYLLAIAPTTGLSIATGSQAGVEPIGGYLTVNDDKGNEKYNMITPELNVTTQKYYKFAIDVDPLQVVEAMSIRQKWVDQGISLNFTRENSDNDSEKWSKVYMRAWELGLKSIYYLNNKDRPKDTECEFCS